ncbi:tRNA (guanosine(46)-N7)-methyltransferase TrmB [Candidatus Izemoplasma sp. B36]|uniref:tRNA (guanosine(46)-N7)-methyltransferase TrmB n=1 Tax=Candidatus Izemoplasma sp. B36 TaxID=3242468 RepID=UPI00355895D0
MRLRNVKHAKELIEKNSHIVIKKPNEYKGLWNKLFNNSNPVELEIGCGKGKFIVDKATLDKNINFIGIEKFDSVIVRGIEKLLEKPLDNVKLIRIDAENIETIFKKSEVNTIYLNFSDPWPKNRHAKKRLTSKKYLDRYSNILVNNGEIRVKTDNYNLFEFSMMSFINHNKYIIEEINLDLYKNLPKDNVQTEFEMKFVEKGNRIYYLKAIYKGESHEKTV